MSGVLILKDKERCDMEVTMSLGGDGSLRVDDEGWRRPPQDWVNDRGERNKDWNKISNRKYTRDTRDANDWSRDRSSDVAQGACSGEDVNLLRKLVEELIKKIEDMDVLIETMGEEINDLKQKVRDGFSLPQ